MPSHGITIRTIGKRSRVRASGQGFDLGDPLIAPHVPQWSRAHRAQTLTEAAPDQHIVTHIHPKPLGLLSDGKRGSNVVLPVLTLHQRNAQITEMAPTGCSTSASMSVAHERVGILASAVPTLPVDRARLATAVP